MSSFESLGVELESSGRYAVGAAEMFEEVSDLKEATGSERMQAPPFLQGSASVHERGESANIFRNVLEHATKIIGITSSIDDQGVKWLQEIVKPPSNRCVLVVLAVFAGCRTRRNNLESLLDLQNDAELGQIQFRILPMEKDSGAPSNCLIASTEKDPTPMFLVGPTPNFGIGNVDRTQVNLCFKAELDWIDQWGQWFDRIWAEAAPLTKSTVEIPALVPATGTSDAATMWQYYCDICRNAVDQYDGNISRRDTESIKIRSGQMENDSEDLSSTSQSPKGPHLPLTKIADLLKIDPLQNRVTKLFKAGHQVTIAHSGAVRPLVVPISPRLLRQDSQIRIGSVVQRQSFSISAFSDNELKTINAFRRASRTILAKLGLPLAKGVYWLPNPAIELFKQEWRLKNNEAKETLGQIVDGDAGGFVDGKKNSIWDDLNRVDQRLGGKGRVPDSTLERVLSDLKRRINHAIHGQLAAPVTYNEVRFLAQEESDGQAPWAQAEKLVLALARFPRKVIAHPKRTFFGLNASDGDILTAMDVENDVILKYWQESPFGSEGRAISEEALLSRISTAEIGSRDRCEATFMLIDGDSVSNVHRFIEEKEACRRS